MEEEQEEECSEQASSYSWWWDSHNHPHQSQWLQSTLSDLDKKIKMMLNLIEEDGDSFAKRAEMYYKKRPELIKMVHDLHRSYRCLAEKYDQLRSESIEVEPDSISRPLSNSFKQVLPHLQISTIRTSSNLNPNSEFETSSFNFEYLNKLADELKQETFSNQQNRDKCGIDKRVDGIESDNNKGVDFCSVEREEVWDELRLKVSKLMEDNLTQQAELIRRNEEKRKAIKGLCIHINRLVDQNKALKSCLAHDKVDNMKKNPSQMSRLKAIILGKLLQ